MKARKIDNFALWREANIQKPKAELEKNGNLAELLGAVYGDGSLYAFQRTEYLRIACNAKYPGWVDRCRWLIMDVFEKEPSIRYRKESECVDVTLYQKHISRRLNIPTGAQGNRHIPLPRWILKNKSFVLRYLRGLYEAEGSFSVHEPTYTYKFIFTNRNDSLLDQVERLWRKLGFHPHRSKYKIQISRKSEVYQAREVIQFRDY